MNASIRQAFVALRFLIVMTVILGIAYPLAIFVIAQLAPNASGGSMLTNASGEVVGSSLIGQSFEGDKWFLPRPSAAGDGYDALASSGSNLAADNPALVEAVAERKATIAATDRVDLKSIPADAVTASGSGLDPHISPEYAQLQVQRVASARRLAPATVAMLVDEHTQQRFLGFIGEPRVNVLELNLALEQLT
ncbi:MAG TPA: potassium-transporting ATPase subunit C [Actinobacteria bacterium]|nr:potassium-transporting ATPase subunit C [Actinomycetota bacterium]